MSSSRKVSTYWSDARRAEDAVDLSPRSQSSTVVDTDAWAGSRDEVADTEPQRRGPGEQGTRGGGLDGASTRSMSPFHLVVPATSGPAEPCRFHSRWKQNISREAPFAHENVSATSRGVNVSLYACRPEALRA